MKPAASLRSLIATRNCLDLVISVLENYASSLSDCEKPIVERYAISLAANMAAGLGDLTTILHSLDTEAASEVERFILRSENAATAALLSKEFGEKALLISLLSKQALPVTLQATYLKNMMEIPEVTLDDIKNSLECLTDPE